MSFDGRAFGAVAHNARPANSSLCFGGRYDDDKHFGMIRMSDLLAIDASIRDAPQTHLDFLAASFVFTAFGLSKDQVRARAEAGKYVVEWPSSARAVFDNGPDHTWDVPVAIVVFQREW